MRGIILFSIPIVVLASAGVWTITNTQGKLANAELELRQCGARLSNLIEDLESDNEIDRLPNSALVDVPDHWLLP